MTKKINTEAIANELKGSSFFQPEKQASTANDDVTSENDITTSQADVTLPATHISNEESSEEKEETLRQGRLDTQKLTTVIKSLSEIPTATFTTPVRLSPQEKQDIEDFIYIKLRQNGVQGNAVSMSKLMRYCLRYLMKVHEDELIEALKNALHKDTSLPI